MLLVDTVQGRVIDDEEIKEKYASRQPYGEWLDNNLTELKSIHIPNYRVPEYTYEERQRMQKAFGYTYDEMKQSILPMAKNGSEAIAAMGVDTPLPVLSKTNHPLFHYFKQLFAQVTNPPGNDGGFVTQWGTDILRDTRHQQPTGGLFAFFQPCAL
jgi:glutamate synthase (ferredoxin)